VNDRATKTLKKVLVVYLKESLQLQHSLEAWGKAWKTSLLMLVSLLKIKSTMLHV
jgi:hypothetical protein